MLIRRIGLGMKQVCTVLVVGLSLLTAGRSLAQTQPSAPNITPPASANTTPTKPPAGTNPTTMGQTTKPNPATSAGSNATTGTAPGGSTPAPSTTAPSATAPTASPTSAAPASVMQVKRELAGDFSYRFVTPTDNAAPPIPLPASAGADNTIALTVPAVLAQNKAALLEVLDNGRGKIARLPISTGQVATLNETAFTLVQTVLVPVVSKGNFVVGASVTLTEPTKKYRQSWLLKPADNGVAQFAAVPLSTPVTVTVSAGSNAPISQTQTIAGNTTPDGYRWPPIEVTWPDVKTIVPPPPPAPATSAGTGLGPATTLPNNGQPAPTGNGNGGGFGGILSTLISLLFLAGIGYGLYWAYSNNKLGPFFSKLGIQTQPVADAGAGAAPGSPFDKPSRAPITPITEGTADPFGGSGAVVGAVAPTPSAGPRLVATAGTYAGSIFPLTGSLADIGRDAGNPVPLPNDTNASRRHATLNLTGGQATVTDNGSSNGTFVNGVKIPAQSPQPLRPGDELQIGLTRFRFEN